jgi:hypothetical protein
MTTRPVRLPERLMASLARCAEREGTDVDTLAARWLSERENDEMRRRLLEAAGANKANPMVVYEKACAVTMFDLHVRLMSDGRERGLWVFLKDESPERERHYARMQDPEGGGRLNEGGLLEWPAARAFHAAMGRALRGRPR